MKKFLKYFSIVVVSIIAILVVASFFIPIERYKEKLYVEVKKATGRDLIIDGKMSLSLFPSPTITAHDIKLSSLAGSINPSMIEVQKASASLAVLPLLTGNIVISDINLDSPQINLEVLKDGRANWDFAKARPTDSQSSQSPAKSSDSAIHVQHISIKNGNLQYLKADTKFGLSDLNADVDIKGVKGPIHFKLQEKTLAIQGNIKEIGDIIPVNAEIKYFNNSILIDGNIDTKNSAFAGKMESHGNLSDIIKEFGIVMPQGLTKNYTLTTELKADKNQADIDSIIFKSGDINLSGKGTYSFTNNNGALQIGVNPGSINIKLAVKGADSMEGVIELTAAKISPLVTALEIDYKKMPPIFEQELFVKATISYKGDNLLFKSITLTAGKASLTGWAELAKEKNLYNIKLSNGSLFTKLLGLDLPVNLSEVLLKGQTTKKDNNIITNTTIITANAESNVEGSIGTGNNTDISLTIKTKGSNLAQTIYQLSSNVIPGQLGAFSFDTAVKGKLSKNLDVTVNSSVVNLGKYSTNLTGKSAILMDGAKPKISLTLDASGVNLDGLMGTTAGNSTASYQGASQAKATSVNASGHSKWSGEKIDLSFLQSFDGDFNIAIRSISKGSLMFDSIKSKMTVSDGVLNLQSLTMGLYGGKFEGSGLISGQAGQKLKIHGALNNAHLKNIVPEQNKFKITEGIFNLDMTLNSAGGSQYQYVQNLAGNVNFNAHDGKLAGINLQKTVDAVTNIKNLQAILQIFNSAFSGGETNFKTFKGSLAIDKGIGQLQNCTLEADSAHATAAGYIDLPRYVMDINANLKIDIKNMPPFKAHIYGALDNPMHQLDTSAMQQYLLGTVLNNAMKNIKINGKNPADLIQGIMGGGNTNAEPAAPANNTSGQSSSGKGSINDVIQQGLKKLIPNS